MFVYIKLPNYIKNSFIVILVLILIGFALPASAAIYSGCIIGWGDEHIKRKTISIYPIGKLCYHKCNSLCTRAYSKIYQGTELNQDIIYNCISACRNDSSSSYGNNIFTSKIRIPLDDKDKRKKDYNTRSNFLPFAWSKDTINIHLCSNDVSSSDSAKCHCSNDASSLDSARYNYYNSEITVGDSYEYKINVIITQGHIFSGQHVAQYIFPYKFSLNKTRYDNKGTVGWDVQQQSFLDTNIIIENGDYLHIEYGGTIIEGDQEQYATALKVKFSTDDPFVFAYPDSSETNSNSNQNGYIGGDSCYSMCQGIKHNQFSEQVNIYKYYHLPRNWSARSWCKYIAGKESWMVEDDNSGYRNCFPTVSYQGTYNGGSGHIRLMHNLSVPQNSQQALGGYYVYLNIKKQFDNSYNRLQIAAVPNENEHFISKIPNYNPIAAGIQWHDITADNVHTIVNKEGQSYLQLKDDFLSDKSGKLFFRIKPTANEAEFFSHSSGKFDITIEKITNPKKITSSIKITESMDGTVEKINNYLIGNNDSGDGVIPKIFEALSHGAFMNAIRLMMVFYIAYTGISFMTGIAPISQYEVLVRVTKLSIVVALISPNSWELFHNHFFNLFTEAGPYLLRVMSSIDDESSGSYNSLFTHFATPLDLMFSGNTWCRAFALLGKNISGFLFFLLMLIAVIIYLLTVIRIFGIYLQSIIMIAFLIMLGPVFISLLLFRYTAKMFESWWKQLLSFILQPIFVFVPVLILNKLLIASMKAALPSSVCQGCVLYFDIGIGVGGGCLIPGWIVLDSMSMPAASIFSLPLTIVTGIIFFAMIAHTYYKIVDLGTEIAMRLSTGGWQGINLGAGGSHSILGHLASIFANVTPNFIQKALLDNKVAKFIAKAFHGGDNPVLDKFFEQDKDGNLNFRPNSFSSMVGADDKMQTQIGDTKMPGVMKALESKFGKENEIIAKLDEYRKDGTHDELLTKVGKAYKDGNPNDTDEVKMERALNVLREHITPNNSEMNSKLSSMKQNLALSRLNSSEEGGDRKAFSDEYLAKQKNIGYEKMQGAMAALRPHLKDDSPIKAKLDKLATDGTNDGLLTKVGKAYNDGNPNDTNAVRMERALNVLQENMTSNDPEMSRELASIKQDLGLAPLNLPEEGRNERDPPASNAVQEHMPPDNPEMMQEHTVNEVNLAEQKDKGYEKMRGIMKVLNFSEDSAIKEFLDTIVIDGSKDRLLESIGNEYTTIDAGSSDLIKEEHALNVLRVYMTDDSSVIQEYSDMKQALSERKESAIASTDQVETPFTYEYLEKQKDVGYGKMQGAMDTVTTLLNSNQAIKEQLDKLATDGTDDRLLIEIGHEQSKTVNPEETVTEKAQRVFNKMQVSLGEKYKQDMGQ